jgi:tetratricopeptide (TPR) repeat protein
LNQPKSILKRISLLFLIVLSACAPYRNNPLSNSYHDMTAHYNAYFIAKERIKEIEQSIFDGQEWNYNKVLPIFAQFDTTTSASLKTQLEDCIQKSSLAIQRHEGSKWEDDSYVLVGKARHFASEFPDAIETFKYVNTHSEDDNVRHYALTELIKSFTEFGEYNNAIAVTDFLAKEDLNNENKRRLYLNTAYLHQKRDDPSKMVGNLVKAEALLTSSDKARINFIIGQTYHSLDFESEAFRYYKNVLRNKPTYELEFYAKLYMAQVTELAKSNDLKKIEKYFRSLLKDSKNKEYQDKIYFELAGFELKNGHLDNAIKNYKLSIKNSQNNQRQKGHSYWSLGKIYYDTLKNFVLAKSYYDSTVSTMPQDEESYESIKKRQEILVDFVKQIVVIQKNDSLLHLATLPQDSVLAMAVTIIEKDIETEKKKKAKEKESAINRARNISKTNGDNIISTTIEDWYFNNPSIQSKGKNVFINKWGERPLEDNWRRSNKSSALIKEEEEPIEIEESISKTASEDEKPDIEGSARKLMSAIPTTDEEKEKLLSEVEDALYSLGNIYNLRLSEDKNAITSFESLLKRFPKTAFEPEVLYQLYLLNQAIDMNQSSRYGEILKKKYPESIFAKLVDNPNYREESFAISSLLKKLYKQMYGQYEGGMFREVLFSADSVLRIHPESEFSDNIALLRVLAIGQVDEDHKYQFELNNFSKIYPESELVEYAHSLEKASESFQQKRYNSAKARFIEDFNQKHFFVIVYDIKQELNQSLPGVLDDFLKQNNFTSLKTGNLILSDEKSMLLVDDFPGKGSATSFSQLFESQVSLKNQFKGERFDVFVITADNFDILYKTKDVSAYLNFFENNY